MINSPGKTFSRENIGQLIDLDKERSIDVIITRLRKKIEIQKLKIPNRKSTELKEMKIKIKEKRNIIP